MAYIIKEINNSLFLLNNKNNIILGIINLTKKLFISLFIYFLYSNGLSFLLIKYIQINFCSDIFFL